MKPIVLSCCLAGMLAVALAWEVMPAEPGADRREGGVPAARARPAATGPDRRSSFQIDADALPGVANTITRRPLFNSSRRPPDEPTLAAAENLGRDDLPRLAGVIVGPSGGRAIFVDPDGKSHAATEGDAVGGFRVRMIRPGLVTLSRSGGDRQLRPTYVRSTDGRSTDSRSLGAGDAARTAMGTP
jgi:hypothetical protein